MTNIVIVDKSGSLKETNVKNFNTEELFKKCGFKKADNFVEQVEWKVKMNKEVYYVNVYAKTNGKANSENKYDFPPPIDNHLFFGNCAIVAYLKNESKSKMYIDLSLTLWEKIYEKLFGGFEDLSATCLEDENEEDELANVPKEKKTKDGYLKDGFVVDSSDSESAQYTTTDDDNGDDHDNKNSSEEEEEDVDASNANNELCEEEYEYDD
jgi:hypothetical protein